MFYIILILVLWTILCLLDKRNEHEFELHCSQTSLAQNSNVKIPTNRECPNDIKKHLSISSSEESTFLFCLKGQQNLSNKAQLKIISPDCSILKNRKEPSKLACELETNSEFCFDKNSIGPIDLLKYWPDFDLKKDHHVKVLSFVMDSNNSRNQNQSDMCMNLDNYGDESSMDEQRCGSPFETCENRNRSPNERNFGSPPCQPRPICPHQEFITTAQLNNYGDLSTLSGGSSMLPGRTFNCFQPDINPAVEPLNSTIRTVASSVPTNSCPHCQLASTSTNQALNQSNNPNVRWNKIGGPTPQPACRAMDTSAPPPPCPSGCATRVNVTAPGGYAGNSGARKSPRRPQTPKRPRDTCQTCWENTGNNRTEQNTTGTWQAIQQSQGPSCPPFFASGQGVAGNIQGLTGGHRETPDRIREEAQNAGPAPPQCPGLLEGNEVFEILARRILALLQASQEQRVAQPCQSIQPIQPIQPIGPRVFAPKATSSMVYDTPPPPLFNCEVTPFSPLDETEQLSLVPGASAKHECKLKSPEQIPFEEDATTCQQIGAAVCEFNPPNCCIECYQRYRSPRNTE